jgi:tetrahydromethanopterin S-methyltransferase subunit A
MSKAADISASLISPVAPALNEIARGMELKKCRKCGCMKDALDQATRAFDSSEDPEIRALLPRISQYQTRMEPLAYDCIGCKKCWGADATIALANHFEDVEFEGCGDGDEIVCGGSKAAAAGCESNASHSATPSWPPYPGDYVLGNLQGTVAVCTLSSRDLALRLIAAEDPDLAIAGRCDTENIGVEKVVLNLLANPRIRWLVICGEEAKGHRAGDAFLQLKERGVDANMRVLESASWRPILKNLTLLEVARFREQIALINLIGVTYLDNILAAARDCAGVALPSLVSTPGARECCNEKLAAVERIRARAPKQLRLDRAGFFIVIPQPQKGLIVCEHYENSGRLVHVIEGRQAALIAATAVERGLVTQLDHAAYLGRELAKAEVALLTHTVYEQDAALGELSGTQRLADSHETKESGQRCSETGACTDC